ERLKKQLENALPENFEWINGATFIYRLRSQNRNFDKDMQAEGFERFRDLLEGMTDVVELRSAPGKGHMEVRRVGGPPSEDDIFDAALLWDEEGMLTEEDYLDLLEQARPRVTPSQQRPNIIVKIYDLMESGRPETLNQLKSITLAEF